MTTIPIHDSKCPLCHGTGVETFPASAPGAVWNIPCRAVRPEIAVPEPNPDKTITPIPTEPALKAA